MKLTSEFPLGSIFNGNYFTAFAPLDFLLLLEVISETHRAKRLGRRSGRQIRLACSNQRLRRIQHHAKNKLIILQLFPSYQKIRSKIKNYSVTPIETMFSTRRFTGSF